LHCQSLPQGTPSLTPLEVSGYLQLVPEWQVGDEGTQIRRRLRFGGFSEAVDFLSRVAPIANEQDHHPDVKLTQYRWLEFEFSTHSIGGLSLNDFIMAAKVDQLYASYSEAKQ
jgi:4a-hydroxytetrahydrobiopterin dehydratase